MSELLESLPPTPPMHFFGLSLEVPEGKKGKALPSTSDLFGETSFADVHFSWTQEGIALEVRVKHSLKDVVYPDFEKGDAFEFFFDTRDLKTAGFPTRFCHHFLVLPKEVQSVQCLELTRFRTDDTHPLADGGDILVKPTFALKGYALQILFPAHVLHGYDPRVFDRLGFTYVLHRAGGAPQHFALSSRFYSVEQQPSLWASIQLKAAT
ncbi:MAG: hypothetical protein JSR58_04150 [Verrucomicrobia bacterium]|nr:hypothetical protein [Verrucomicrobiota bacterium]